MPRYVFDLNEGDSPEWDDEDLVLNDRGDIEQHARILIVGACKRMAGRGAGSLPCTVVVYEGVGGVIMSAQGWHDGTIRVSWAQKQVSSPAVKPPDPNPRDRAVREHARGVLLDLVDRLGEMRRNRA